MVVPALQALLSLVSHAFGVMQLAALVDRLATKIIVSCLILVGLVILLGLGLLLYRRRWLAGETTAPDAGWTFDDIRKLRDQGQLSEAEYQALRSALIGTYKGESVEGQSSATAPETEVSDEKGLDFDVKKSPPA